MIVECVTSGLLKTNAYLVWCKETKKAIIIDPAQGSKNKLISLIEENDLKIKGIYLTHSHFDHFADAAKLKRHLQCPLFVHELDKQNLKHPGSDGILNIIDVEPVKEDGYLTDGQIIKVGMVQFRVIHTPGHSPGCICFYFEKERALFSGDTLFKQTHGNVTFQTSSEKDMYESLSKLIKLSDNVKVYPGHMETTTIGEEKEWITSLLKEQKLICN